MTGYEIQTLKDMLDTMNDELYRKGAPRNLQGHVSDCRRVVDWLEANYDKHDVR